MKLNGLRFSMAGMIVGIILYELYHKGKSGKW